MIKIKIKKIINPLLRLCIIVIKLKDILGNVGVLKEIALSLQKFVVDT